MTCAMACAYMHMLCTAQRRAAPTHECADAAGVPGRLRTHDLMLQHSLLDLHKRSKADRSGLTPLAAHASRQRRGPACGSEHGAGQVRGAYTSWKMGQGIHLLERVCIAALAGGFPYRGVRRMVARGPTAGALP